VSSRFAGSIIVKGFILMVFQLSMLYFSSFLLCVFVSL